MILDALALSRSGVDRAAHRRTDPDWLAAAWVHPASRCLVVGAAQVLVRDDGAGPRLHVGPPVDAPDGERYFLGVDSAGVDSAGVDAACFAVAVDALPAVDGAAPAGLREIGTLLDDRDAGLAVHAIALANWHAAHPRCARCGAETVVAAAGHVRRCPADGSEHYPRTDAAVIMAVVDANDRLLLGRQPRWPARRFSTLAGFVEPGESLEQAVRREVMEETGVAVGDVRYVGSQPWPFPSSLMLGFVADALSTELTVDGEEIAEAHWFRRSDLGPAVAAGEVLLPPPVSIARRLIEQWYGGPLGA